MSTLNYKYAPQNAGVYIFRRRGIPLYIGKAANLKKRLSSYFRKNVGGKIAEMLREAIKLDWIETESEIEALIKEAELIKQYRPKYNHLLRDDKNYFYVSITKEVFPRIFLTHQRQPGLRVDYVGPFTSGSALKSVLRLLRRLFPYCTCKKQHKRFCLNTGIGRCPGYCCIKNYPDSNRSLATWIVLYRKNIKNISGVLKGKKQVLIKKLRREMRQAARDEDFALATQLRDQMLGLENVFRHRLILDTKRHPGHWFKIQRALQSVLKTARPISRVEGYDISNISGAEATGSMVIFEDGFPKKSEYRKFKIGSVKGSNDVLMLKEVIRRRLKHREWPYPDLMLIDGGKPQLNAALSQLSALGNQQPGKTKKRKAASRLLVAALAKREEELYVPRHGLPIRLTSLPVPTAHFLQRVRDESHRFAKKYHHKLREIYYREEKP